MAVLAALLVAAVAAPAAQADDISESKGFRKGVTLAGVREHQAAFQAISDASGGNRVGGSPGFNASRDYVMERMEDAGYEVSLHSFTFVYNADATPPTLSQVSPDSDGLRRRRRLRVDDLLRLDPDHDEAGVRRRHRPATGARAGSDDLRLRGRGLRRVPGRSHRAHAARDVPIRPEGATWRPPRGAAASIIFNDGGDAGRIGVINGTLGEGVHGPAVGTSLAVGTGPCQRDHDREYRIDRDDPDRPGRGGPHDPQRHRRDARGRSGSGRRRRRPPGQRPARTGHQRQRQRLGDHPRDRRGLRRAGPRPAQQAALHVVRRGRVRSDRVDEVCRVPLPG